MVDVILVVKSEQRGLTVDFLKLFAEILPDTLTKFDQTLKWVILCTSLDSHTLECCKDLFYSWPDLFHRFGLQHLLYGDFLQELVIFARYSELGVDVGISIELHDNTEFIALLQDSEDHLDLF
jgi:hypothetical protein